MKNNYYISSRKSDMNEIDFSPKEKSTPSLNSLKNSKVESGSRFTRNEVMRNNDDSKGKNTFNENNNLRENYQTKYRETNQELIKYIYSTIDISQFNYDLLRYEHQLSKFISGKYYVSPIFRGKNCFLVFTKLKSKYYTFLIDRKQLSYTLDKVQFENVFIHHCNVDVDISIYAGTIFDGVYIKKDNNHEFIITDVYHFKGHDYTDNNLSHKMFEIQMYLDNLVTAKYNREKTNSKTILELKVNKLHEITETRKLIESDVKNYKNDYQIKGICFYPEMSGTKLLHIFDNIQPNKENMIPYHKNSGDGSEESLASDNQKDDKYNSDKYNSDRYNSDKYNSDRYNSDKYNNDKYNGDDSMKKSKSLIKRVYVAKTNDPIYAILEMKATKTADNYKMFAVEQVKVGDSVRLKKCQMDIAYIPDLEKSKWCRDIVTNSQSGTVFVKCVWRENKKKWEPLELKNDMRLPSLMDDIRKNLVEMEESDSDTDEE